MIAAVHRVSNIFRMTEPFQAFLQKCISVDLEVDPGTAAIFVVAAVRDDARSSILGKKRAISAALDRLETEAADAAHLIGHNIIRHVECAPAGGQDQAAVLTGCRVC